MLDLAGWLIIGGSLGLAFVIIACAFIISD